MTMLAEPIAPTTEKPLPKPHQLFPSEIEEIQSQEHTEICARFITALIDLFQPDENANVGGDQGFYWNHEDDRDCAAPDAYLIRNAGKALRKNWKLWEERAAHPNLSIEFLLEVWSEGNSFSQKLDKFLRYQQLQAKEFFQLDYPEPVLLGHRLSSSGIYTPIEPNADGRLQSHSLGAELAFEGGLIQLYRDGKKTLTLAEAQAKLSDAESKLDAERLAKEAERQRADAERQAKEAALAEIERLKKELEK